MKTFAGADQSNCDFWVITSLFNPNGYVSRKRNYKAFRSRLSLPLICVELAGDRFELGAGDADVLVQIRSDSVLFHKERLLNIALDCLPDSAKYVAWLDCDLVYPDRNWPRLARAVLEEHRLVQLWSRMREVRVEELALEQLPYDPQRRTGEGIVSRIVTGQASPDELAPDDANDGAVGQVGFAWAAHVDMMRRARFYDAMVVGGGDRAIACAAYGRFDDLVGATCMNAHRAAHYRRWAHGFRAEVAGLIGYLDQEVHHLWHGSQENRRYRSRHAQFAEVAFNPATDLVEGPSGEWRWRPASHPAQALLMNYFAGRREDG